MRGRIRIAIACAGVLVASAAGARAQTTFRETGSVTVGGYIVWVRGTSANAVELFVGRGFRDAFARAHEMDAARLQHWIDSVGAVVPRPASDTSVAEGPLLGSAVSIDVTMLRRVGGPFSGLRLLVNGEEPITMAEPTARDFIAALGSAVHAARDLTPESVLAHMLPGDAPLPSDTTATTRVAAAPVPTPPSQAVVNTPDVKRQVVVAVATPARAPAPAPSPMIGVAPSAPDSVAAAPLGPTTTQAAPELVLAAPSQPVLQLASRVEIVPVPLPKPVLAAPADPRPSVVAAPVVAAPVVAAPVVDSASTSRPVPAPVRVPAPAPDTVTSPRPEAPADKLIRTPLGPFTIPGALLADRDKEAQYCYTQLGLKYNPDLKGEITVKVLVGADGTVHDAVVTKRSWQGISAGEVESCVRALAHDWTFAATDPSVTDGAKLLTFSFAPQIASTP